MKKRKEAPSICIVGRPNVGKSSLFNRLVGRRRAVVTSEAGTTRNRVDSSVVIGKYSFTLTDTGGFMAENKLDALTRKVKEQIHKAAEGSSLVIMVADVKSGPTGADFEVMKILKRLDKPVILVVNKVDNEALAYELAEFYKLGFGEPIGVSCMHNSGMRELKDKILGSASELSDAAEEKSRAVKIAVIGRPNVGKSSFINNLLREERVIVSDIPGTTRDSVDTFFSYGAGEYILIDTAGIRHKRKIKSASDTYSVMRSGQAVRRADVALLLLSAADGATRDDLMILDMVEEEGKACAILVNKWDLASDAAGKVTCEEYEKELFRASARLRKYPLLFVSAKTGKNVAKSISLAASLNEALDYKAQTALLNRMLGQASPARVPIPRSSKRPNFFYMVQTSSRPIEFVIFVNDTRLVLNAHERFIENVLRSHLPLKGISIKVRFRRSKKSK